MNNIEVLFGSRIAAFLEFTKKKKKQWLAVNNSFRDLTLAISQRIPSLLRLGHARSLLDLNCNPSNLQCKVYWFQLSRFLGGQECVKWELHGECMSNVSSWIEICYLLNDVSNLVRIFLIYFTDSGINLCYSYIIFCSSATLSSSLCNCFMSLISR